MEREGAGEAAAGGGSWISPISTAKRSTVRKLSTPVTMGPLQLATTRFKEESRFDGMEVEMLVSWGTGGV